jgi:DNA-binding NarL/FixJ family response regulator
VLDEALIAEALQHGAKGYAPKTATPDELIKAIRTSYAGELWVRRVLLTQVVERLRHQLQCRKRRQLASGSALGTSIWSSRTSI